MQQISSAVVIWLYFSLSFSPISSPSFSPLVLFTPFPRFYLLIHVPPMLLSPILLSRFSLPYFSSMSPQFCNPIFSLPWTSFPKFLSKISLLKFIISVSASQMFGPLFSLPWIPLQQFLSQKSLPEWGWFYVFSPQRSMRNLPIFKHRAVVLSAFPTYFYMSAAQ